MSGAEERRLSQEESGEGERAKSKKEKEKERSKEREKENNKEKEEGKDQNKDPAAAVDRKVTDDKVTANPLNSPKKDASTDPLEDPGALNMFWFDP